MLVVIVLMLSATVGVIGASSNETRFNNTILASSVAAVSSSGLLTVTNQYQVIPGKQPKVRSRLILRRKRGDCFGSALILASLITNGTMWYTITFMPAITRSSFHRKGHIASRLSMWYPVRVVLLTRLLEQSRKRIRRTAKHCLECLSVWDTNEEIVGISLQPPSFRLCCCFTAFEPSLLT